MNVAEQTRGYTPRQIREQAARLLRQAGTLQRKANELQQEAASLNGQALELANGAAALLLASEACTSVHTYGQTPRRSRA